MTRGIAGEFGIDLGVFNDEEFGLLNGVGAEGDASGCLLYPFEPHVGFEPLSVVVYQADQGNRSSTDR